MQSYQAILLFLILQHVTVSNSAVWIFGNDVDDSFDPITGLTGFEKILIKNTWKYLMKNPVKYGSKIFFKYFAKHPEYLVHFPFGSVPLNELVHNAEFKVYCNLVMYVLDAMIDNLDRNPEIVIGILKRISYDIVKDKIRAQPFWELYENIREIILPLVNETTYLAWNKFLKLATNILGMGLIYSLFNRVDPGVADPITGLTSRDIKLLQSSWGKAMENSTATGSLIMTSFFQKYPERKLSFPFKDVEMEKLKDDPRFKVHCNIVMYSLTQIIDNLNDADLVLAMLDKLALNHSKRKVPAKGFDDIKDVILDILQTQVSKEAFESWMKLFDVAIERIKTQIT